MSTGTGICLLGFTEPISRVNYLKLSYKVCTDSFIPKNLRKTLTVSPCRHRQKKLMATLSKNVGNDYGNDNGDVIRRSYNYDPNQWDYDSIGSITNNYTEGKYGALARDLKEEVCALFNVSDPLEQVKLIDSVERLGLGYHFEQKINTVLNDMMTSGYTNLVQNDGLHATSVLFRLLRQHGFMVSEDIFKPFMNDESNFKESLSHDVEGLISLYQASYQSIKGESILDAAKLFSATHLKRFSKSKFAEEIAYAMDLPSHWRPKRLETRRYIDIYEKEADMKLILLQFAKLDFNMVQNIHQMELTKVTNWWMSEGFAHKLKFARDRTFESFFVAVIIEFQPQLRYIRERLTKVVALLVILDDIYDIYGSLDELELFTHMVDRWEIKELENLPNYMKTLFKAIISIVDETACDIQKHNGLNIRPFLREAWAGLCKAFLVEAKWQSRKYTPTYTEYISNGWMSVSGPLILTYAFFLLIQLPTDEALEHLESSPKIIRLASINFRLYNDLASSTAEQERGDAPTSIQCYMKEMGVSEVKAREHISGVISETWKELNKEYMLCSSFPRPFAEACVNLARMAVCLYQQRDGFSIPTFETKGFIQSLLIKPINIIWKDFSYPNLQSINPKEIQQV